jgi:hypothetical protein
MLRFLTQNQSFVWSSPDWADQGCAGYSLDSVGFGLQSAGIKGQRNGSWARRDHTATGEMARGRIACIRTVASSRLSSTAPGGCRLHAPREKSRFDAGNGSGPRTLSSTAEAEWDGTGGPSPFLYLRGEGNADDSDRPCQGDQRAEPWRKTAACPALRRTFLGGPRDTRASATQSRIGPVGSSRCTQSAACGAPIFSGLHGGGDGHLDESFEGHG